MFHIFTPKDSIGNLLSFTGVLHIGINDEIDSSLQKVGTGSIFSLSSSDLFGTYSDTAVLDLIDGKLDWISDYKSGKDVLHVALFMLHNSNTFVQSYLRYNRVALKDVINRRVTGININLEYPYVPSINSLQAIGDLYVGLRENEEVQTESGFNKITHELYLGCDRGAVRFQILNDNLGKLYLWLGESCVLLLDSKSGITVYELGGISLLGVKLTNNKLYVILYFIIKSSAGRDTLRGALPLIIPFNKVEGNYDKVKLKYFISAGSSFTDAIVYSGNFIDQQVCKQIMG